MAHPADSALADSPRPGQPDAISARTVLFWLLGGGALLAVLSIATKVLDDLPGMATLEPIFDLNGEGNVAAWYGSALWLLSGTLAALIAISKRAGGGEFVVHWFGIAAVCVFLSIDEAALIHETMGNVLRRSVFDRWPQLDIDGGWIYSWMYYGIALVAAFLLLFRRFMLHLPRRILIAMVVAGAVFLTGALGIESISAAVEHENIREPTGNEWTAIITAEEGFEMAGVALFVYALMLYVAAGEVTLRLPIRE